MRTCVAQLYRRQAPLASCAAAVLAALLFAPSPAPAQSTSAPLPVSSPSQAGPSTQPSLPAAEQPTPPAKLPGASAPVGQAYTSDVSPISEDEVRQQLLGKTFYLRGGWLDNSLHFDDQGFLNGFSPTASYTLSLVDITSVHLDKHHLELEGVRYGLHFLGAATFEDQALDRVRLTTKKKPLRITIDREQVVVPKKKKRETMGVMVVAPAGTAEALSPGQINSAIAVAPGPFAHHGTTVTTSQAEANRALRGAIDAVLASGIDQRMIATLPPYWKLYYDDAAAKQNYRPSDPAVLHQNQVDKKARLISIIDPPSNDYAQKNGVAGMSMYHVVVEPNGKAGEIAVGRPIGFGLDENAVDAIRRAKFDPAIKDGKPVPVVLDLVVEFRIYSKLTDTAAAKPAGPVAPVLPGPYTVKQPKPAAGQPQ